MWFRMPKEMGAISVQQQQFTAVFSDDTGAYFQAPDHFAPEILGIKGFESCERPKGVPKSITNMEPKRDAAMKNLADQVSSQANELRELRTSLNAVSADLRAAQHANSELMQQIAEKTAECASLRERLADFEDEHHTNEAVAKAQQIPTLEKESDEDDDE